MQSEMTSEGRVAPYDLPGTGLGSLVAQTSSVLTGSSDRLIFGFMNAFRDEPLESPAFVLFK